MKLMKKLKKLFTIGMVLSVVALVTYLSLYGWEALLKVVLNGVIFTLVISVIVIGTLNKYKDKKLF